MKPTVVAIKTILIKSDLKYIPMAQVIQQYNFGTYDLVKGT